MNDELSDVNGLDNWERSVLKEVDPDYECSDDDVDYSKAPPKPVEEVEEPVDPKKKKK